MEQTLAQSGEDSKAWWAVYAGAAVLVGVVYVTTDFGLPATVAGVAGLLFVLFGLRSIRQAVASRSVEREAIGSLGGRAGAVEIEGTASPAGESVTAPMTGTECVAYRVEVLRDEPTREES